MRKTETQKNFRKQMKRYNQNNKNWQNEQGYRRNWAARPSRINRDMIRSYLILAGIIIAIYFFQKGG